MPSSNRSLNSFLVAGTNECLNFSLSRSKFDDLASLPDKIWSGSRVPRLAKKSVAPKRRS